MAQHELPLVGRAQVLATCERAHHVCHATSCADERGDERELPGRFDTLACHPRERVVSCLERTLRNRMTQMASVFKGGSKGLPAREHGEIPTDKHGREDRRTGTGMENRVNAQPPRPPRAVLTRIIA